MQVVGQGGGGVHGVGDRGNVKKFLSTKVGMMENN